MKSRQEEATGWSPGGQTTSSGSLPTATTIQPKEGCALSTKAQQTYERIEALKGEGMTQPDAIRKLAEEYGQSTDSVRGAYYTGKKQATGETSSAPRSTRPRQQRETTDTDAIGWAVTTLENAISSIETEVETARIRAEEAQAEYDSISKSSGPRIEKIRVKIAALRDGENSEPDVDSPDTDAKAKKPDPGASQEAKQ